jgi:hypothetical protein
LLVVVSIYAKEKRDVFMCDAMAIADLKKQMKYIANALQI